MNRNKVGRLKRELFGFRNEVQGNGHKRVDLGGTLIDQIERFQYLRLIVDNDGFEGRGDGQIALFLLLRFPSC